MRNSVLDHVNRLADMGSSVILRLDAGAKLLHKGLRNDEMHVVDIALV